jgi:hypothetical protein
MRRGGLRLSIRAKMLLVSCVLLAIPGIAYRYAEELERILRENQETAVLNTARAIATALNDRPSMFVRAAADAASNSANAIVAYKLPQPIMLDGVLDDWLRQGVDLRALGREHVIEQADDAEVGSVSLWHASGVYDNELYAAFEIIDERIVYRNAEHPRADSADHVRIGLLTPWGELRRYVLATAGPGPVAAIQVPTDSGFAAVQPETRIQGFWKETPSGFNLELRLPRALVGARLGFAFADVNLCDQTVMIESCIADHRNTDAAMYVENVVILDVREAPHIFENRLGQSTCLVSRGLRHQNHKLVTTESCNLAAAPDRTDKLVGNLAQHAVSRRVPAGIVYVLELVQVNKHQCAGLVIDADVVNFLFQLLDKAAPIE